MVQPPRPEIRAGRRPRASAPGVEATAAQRRFARALRDSMRREWVTLALLVANVGVFVAMSAQGADVLMPDGAVLLRWGANYGPYTWQGNWWRLISAAFVHAGAIHLGFNMYALWMAGRLVERLYGHAGYALLYATAGLCGSVSSILVHPMIPTVGASGAVFGVFGALLAFLLRRRRLLPAAVLKRLAWLVGAIVLFNVFFGFVVPRIDQAGHLGGLAGGFVAGLLLAPRFEDGCLRRPWALYPVAAAIGAGLVSWVAA